MLQSKHVQSIAHSRLKHITDMMTNPPRNQRMCLCVSVCVCDNGSCAIHHLPHMLTIQREYSLVRADIIAFSQSYHRPHVTRVQRQRNLNTDTLLTSDISQQQALKVL